MELHFIETQYTATLPYYIYIGDTHIVEVKRGGEQIGIYVITPSLRRRGVVLPYNVWSELISSIDIINLAIDLTKGTLGLNTTQRNEQLRDQTGQTTYNSYTEWPYDETSGRYS
jgi:hypothetical protein